jgi:hypothetical protein
MYWKVNFGKDLQLDGLVGVVGDSKHREPVAETSADGHAHLHRALELPILRDQQVIGWLSLRHDIVDDLDLLHHEGMLS